jgi:HPt (histidine-containing phosphotransfer) domain-containing protein
MMANSAAVDLSRHDQDEEESLSASVLDLVHLSRQTFGDHALETELLTLFNLQAAHFADRLRAPRGGPEDARARIELAHMLKGSAKSIGAFGVAEAAQAYEAALRTGETAGAGCERLLGEIGKARAAIAALL